MKHRHDDDIFLERAICVLCALIVVIGAVLLWTMGTVLWMVVLVVCVGIGPLCIAVLQTIDKLMNRAGHHRMLLCWRTRQRREKPGEPRARQCGRSPHSALECLFDGVMLPSP